MGEEEFRVGEIMNNERIIHSSLAGGPTIKFAKYDEDSEMGEEVCATIRSDVARLMAAYPCARLKSVVVHDTEWIPHVLHRSSDQEMDDRPLQGAYLRSRQRISMAIGCGYDREMLVHEFCHALGLRHGAWEDEMKLDAMKNEIMEKVFAWKEPEDEAPGKPESYPGKD